jgi:hypothetical protein
VPQSDNERLSERNQAIWDGYTLAGKTLVELAHEHGVSYQRISQVLAEIRETLPEEDRRGVVDLRLAQIGAMVKGVLPLACTGDKDAIASWTRLADREAKYLGLDSPAKVEHSGKVATYAITGVDLDKL